MLAPTNLYRVVEDGTGRVIVPDFAAVNLQAAMQVAHIICSTLGTANCRLVQGYGFGSAPPYPIVTIVAQGGVLTSVPTGTVF